MKGTRQANVPLFRDFNLFLTTIRVVATKIIGTKGLHTEKFLSRRVRAVNGLIAVPLTHVQESMDIAHCSGGR